MTSLPRSGSMNLPFGLYGKYYDLMYQDKDYESEAKYVGKLLRGHGLPGNKLLEFGAGSGRHESQLKNQGFEVTGIERSSAMISLAEKNGYGDIRQGDIRDFLAGGIYDGAIALFHVMSYQTEDSDLGAVFQNASAHLAPQGLFLFDFWYTPAVESQKPESRVKTFRSHEIEITRKATPGIRPCEKVVDVHYQVEIREFTSGKTCSFEERHAMRHFNPEELDAFGSEAGMVRVLSEEFGSGRPAGRDTWGVCSLYRKAQK